MVYLRERKVPISSCLHIIIRSLSDCDILGSFPGDGADGLFRERLPLGVGSAPSETVG